MKSGKFNCRRDRKWPIAIRASNPDRVCGKDFVAWASAMDTKTAGGTPENHRRRSEPGAESALPVVLETPVAGGTRRTSSGKGGNGNVKPALI
jgi:hypothetical protein